MSRNLIRELISALNADEYEEANELYEQIKATGDVKNDTRCRIFDECAVNNLVFIWRYHIKYIILSQKGMAKRRFDDILHDNIEFGAKQYAKSRVQFDSCKDEGVYLKSFMTGAKICFTNCY